MRDRIGYVALGSNVGDREAHLRAGLAGMADRGIAPIRQSSIWETEPVGTREPGWFMNMVVQIRSPRLPLEILDVLLDVERGAGRIRSTRNAPRELDLDLLLLGDTRVEDSRLTLPHPRMWQRRFVLSPLAELEPALIDPETGFTVQETLDGLEEGFRVRRFRRLPPSRPAPYNPGRRVEEHPGK